MLDVLRSWTNRYLSHPQAIALVVGLIIFVAIIQTMGKMLAPVLASIVIAYLIDGIVIRFEKIKCPHTLAVSLSCIIAFGLILFAFLWLVPLLWQQLSTLISDTPHTIAHLQTYLQTLSVKYPDYMSMGQLKNMLATFKADIGKFGQAVISYSLSLLPSLISIIVYLILVPVLVFFFLKDKTSILNWLTRFLPRKHNVIQHAWNEINDQIGKYVRGKVIEMLIVTIVSLIAFLILGLNYAVLLAVGVGLSTIIPYVGAIVITIPVLAVGLVQWGLTADFVYLAIAYAIIITLDGNVLSPVLFSETMNLNPAVIIIAVVIFGGIWGFWGVFFAIPLTTVLKAVLNAWPINETTPDKATSVC